MTSLLFSTLTLSLATLSGPLAGPSGEAATSEFGEPLIVDGQRISDLAIKRFLIYDAGLTVLETDRLAILIEKELEHRQEKLTHELAAELFAGRSVDELSDEERSQLDGRVQEAMARFRLDEEYLQWWLAEDLARFQMRYPTLDFATETARNYGAHEWYELQTRRTLEFDACFFPGDPDGWPDLTKEALWSTNDEVDLVLDMKQSWDRRVAQAEENGLQYVPREDEIYAGALRDYVIDALGALVEQKTAAEGLPEELVLTLAGDGWVIEVETEELWPRVQPFVTDEDVRIAKRWLALMAATERRLEEEGYLVSLEEHVAHLHETDVALKEAMFTLEFVAVTGHGFPSTHVFRNHLRAYESYRDKLEAEGILVGEDAKKLSPVVLDSFAIVKPSLELAKVRAEILLVGAFDQERFAWKKDGWAKAKEKAERLRAQIDEHLDKLAAQEHAKRAAAENGENWAPEEDLLTFDRYWSRMLDLHSDYWDPPMPAVGKMPPAVDLQNKGRFGNQVLNDVARSVGETNFYTFVAGRSIAERVFFDMQAGDVGGPFKGPLGYYIVYVKSRSGTTKSLDPENPRHRRQIQDEHLRRSFAEYAQRCLQQAETSGVPEI